MATALILLAAGVAPLLGIRSESELHETFENFHAGEFERISLGRDGTLSLASGADQVAELPDPIVWTAALGPDGELYVGTGNEGKVFRVREGEEPEVLLEAEEVLVRALTVGSDGAVYVGTSPEGRVYRLEPDAEPEEEPQIYFEPESGYIWDLLVDPEGHLLVATGDEGKIFRVPPGGEAEGEAEVFFESRESHVSVMEWDRQGRLLAGTSPQGYLYRIEGPDEAFVLFNSPDEEIRRIEVGEDGDIFVATFSGEPGGRGVGRSSAFISHAMSAIEAAISDQGDAAGAQENNGASSGGAGSPGGNGNGDQARVSAVYRIEEDGFWQPYWTLPGVPVHALLREPDGTLLAGSGVEGGIFAIEGMRDWHLRERLEPGSEVSALLASDDEIWALTSNPARVFRLRHERAREGEYLSKVFDARQVTRWGRLHVDAHEANGGSVVVATRAGNTEEPDKFWTDWSPLSSDGAVASPPARYLQYRLGLRRVNGTGPEVNRVRFFHQRPNAAPDVVDIRVVTASIGLERYEMPPQTPSIDIEQLFRANNNNRQNGQGADRRSQIRAHQRPGMITVAWRARDPNDDALQFTVKLRRHGESEWTVLADEVNDAFLSFESIGFPDGLYRAEIVATDRPSNVADGGLTGRRLSELFAIDNAAPEMTLEASGSDRGVGRIRFRARDEISLISAAGYSVNGDELVRVYPDDGIFDSSDESFDLEIDGLRAGTHHVLIRIADEAGNRSVLNVPVTIE